YQRLHLRRRHAERAEQRLVLVEGAPEGREVAGLRRARAGLDHGRHLVEELLVPRSVRLPARAQPAHRGARAARRTERDDERQRARSAQRGDGRRLAADEAEAAAARLRRRGRIDPRGMAVEDRLEAPAERQLLVGLEPPPRRRRERAQHADRERGRAAEAGARRQLGADADGQAGRLEAERARGLDGERRGPRILRQRRPVALQAERAVARRHLDLEPEPEARGERRPPVDHRMFAQQDHLPRGAAAGREIHERDSRERSSSRARSIFTSPAARSRRRSSSASSPRAPAAWETARACSAMCPFWMPSVAKARMAPRLEASPTAAMMPASSRALATPSSLSARRTRGWDCTSGPTVETAIGSSIEPTRCPFSIPQVVSEP